VTIGKLKQDDWSDDQIDGLSIAIKFKLCKIKTAVGEFFVGEGLIGRILAHSVAITQATGPEKRP
jgi:hypothetical protein